MNFLSKTKKYFLFFLETQIVTSLFSLPILVCWGMPLSIATILGNLIFQPILAIFLVLSSLVFFTELFCIPNNFLIFLLNKLAIFWEKILDLGQNSWLISFAKPNLIILFIIFILSFLILIHKKINSKTKKLTVLAICLFANFLILYLFQTLTRPEKLIFQDKLHITLHNNKLLIKDYGLLKYKRSLDKFLEFELRPFILKNFGTLKIESLKLEYNSKYKNKILNTFKENFDCPSIYSMSST
ncbi:hypothetical protein K9L16_04040 [Candidatus Pacearchaeota archaeon]|nr:hypothetical protein [Candidatus Pacearchaeota archaeon]